MDKSNIEVAVLGKKVDNPILKFIAIVIAIGIIGLLVLAGICLIIALIGTISGLMLVIIAIGAGLVVLLPLLAVIHFVFRASGRRGLVVAEHNDDEHSYAVVFHGACEKIEPQKEE